MEGFTALGEGRRNFSQSSKKARQKLELILKGAKSLPCF